MSNGLSISLKSYDSIFQSEEQRNTEEIKPVPVSYTHLTLPTRVDV